MFDRGRIIRDALRAARRHYDYGGGIDPFDPTPSEEEQRRRLILAQGLDGTTPFQPSSPTTPSPAYAPLTGGLAPQVPGNIFETQKGTDLVPYSNALYQPGLIQSYDLPEPEKGTPGFASYISSALAGLPTASAPAPAPAVMVAPTTAATPTQTPTQTTPTPALVATLPSTIQGFAPMRDASSLVSPSTRGAAPVISSPAQTYQPGEKLAARFDEPLPGTQIPGFGVNPYGSFSGSFGVTPNPAASASTMPLSIDYSALQTPAAITPVGYNAMPMSVDYPTSATIGSQAYGPAFGRAESDKLGLDMVSPQDQIAAAQQEAERVGNLSFESNPITGQSDVTPPAAPSVSYDPGLVGATPESVSYGGLTPAGAAAAINEAIQAGDTTMFGEDQTADYGPLGGVEVEGNAPEGEGQEGGGVEEGGGEAPGGGGGGGEEEKRGGRIGRHRYATDGFVASDDLLARKQEANDPRKYLMFGETDQALPPTGLPIGQAVGTKAAVDLAKGVMAGADLTRQAIEEGRSPDYNNPQDIERVLSAAGVIMPGGIAGVPARAGETVLGSGPINKALSVAREATAQRELSPLGFYSHGAEAAAALPQAKGSVDQMLAMLKKAGVKDAELEAVPEAFAGQTSVTRDELAKHFQENMPVVEERVLGAKANKYPYRTSDEWQSAINRAERNRNFDEAERLTLAWEEAEGYGAADTPKFQQYTLPGGENYREVRLTLPKGYGASKETSDKMAMLTDRAKKAEKAYDDELLAALEGTSKLSNAEFEALRQEADYARSSVRNFEKIANKPLFESAHWPDAPNTVAHLRMSDRIGPNGEKILHVEEIQSDWGQKGKKEGFKGQNPLTDEERNEFNRLNVMPDRYKTPEEIQKLEDFYKRLYGNQSGPPTAPYVTSTQGWTDLALKRVLKEAAEGGYDKVVWTPGAEQAKRYKLSNQVKSIDYMREGDDAYRLGITNKHGEGIDLPKDTFTAKELEDYLGKEVAQKIVADEGKAYRGRNHKTLEGLDLEVGGSGMKAYYDQIVPKRLQELARKHDKSAKVEMGRLPVQNYTISAPDIARELGMSIEAVSALPHDEKMALINTVRHSIAAPSITITPAMRESILKGQTAYKFGGKAYPLAKHGENSLSYMEPKEFLDEARPLHVGKHDRKTIDSFKKSMKHGDKLDPLALYPKNRENGRHRAIAAKELGINKVPVHNYRKEAHGGSIVDKALMLTSRRLSAAKAPK